MDVFRSISIAITFALFFSACSASGPRYQSHAPGFLSDRSEIVILRQSKFGGGASSYCVIIDNQPFGELSNGGYLRKIVSPGNHTISMPLDKDLKLEIATEKNKTHFVLFQLDLAGISPMSIGNTIMANTSWNMGLFEVSEENGKKIVKSLREADLDDDCD